MSWWQDLISQAFNPPVEPGIDVGTPFHTPITALAPGTVVSETSGGYGQRIDIKTISGVTEYYQHLDTIDPAIKVGSHISVGELLGLSGGQLQGGSSPNNPANSTGPHVEFGIIGSGGQPIDPTAVLKRGPSAGGSATAVDSLLSGGGLVNLNFPDPIASLRSWFGSGADQVKAQATGQSGGFFADNIIPLVIAALIIVVVLGSSDKPAASSSPPQIIPVPV